jgi:hypothetical protein
MRIIFSLFLGLVCAGCHHKGKFNSALNFYPQSKKDLYDLGFKGIKPDPECYFVASIKDTIVNFYFPRGFGDKEYVKSIEFERNKFDSTKLFEYYKMLDPSFEASSVFLFLNNGSGIRKKYRIINLHSFFSLEYISPRYEELVRSRQSDEIIINKSEN